MVRPLGLRTGLDSTRNGSGVAPCAAGRLLKITGPGRRCATASRCRWVCASACLSPASPPLLAWRTTTRLFSGTMSAPNEQSRWSVALRSSEPSSSVLSATFTSPVEESSMSRSRSRACSAWFRRRMSPRDSSSRRRHSSAGCTSECSSEKVRGSASASRHGMAATATSSPSSLRSQNTYAGTRPGMVTRSPGASGCRPAWRIDSATSEARSVEASAPEVQRSSPAGSYSSTPAARGTRPASSCA